MSNPIGCQQTNKDINTHMKRIGIIYLLLAPFAILSMFYVPNLISIEESALGKFHVIKEYETLFRWSILSWLLCQSLFLVLVLKLFSTLKAFSHTLATALLCLAALSVPIAFYNEVNNLALVNLPENSVPSIIEGYLLSHLAGLNIAQLFWGFWLIPLALILIKSRLVPLPISFLLLIGAAGYIFDSVAFIIAPTMAFKLSMLTGLGEVIFPLWLIFKGVNAKTAKINANKEIDYEQPINS